MHIRRKNESIMRIDKEHFMDLDQYFPIWDKLTISQQDILKKSSTFRKIAKGTILHSGKADCTGLIVVKSGQIRAYISSDDGKEITLYRLLERDICLFSASCMMPDIQFDIIVEAEKDSEAWIIPAEIYINIMNQSAVVANYTNQIMASRFTDVMWLIEQILWKSFDKRLAKFILDESDLNKSDTLKITHEKIAEHMGSAREVITRMLQYFQSENMVQLTRGTIQLIDRKQLEELAK